MSSDRQVRIKDVAERAGCSIGTVDRVIHGRGRVSEATRKRIREVIEELGYRPNVNARILASKQTLSIGILLPAFEKGEYWELPNAGIRDALDHFSGQGLRIELKRRVFSNPGEYLEEGRRLLGDGVDGIILSPVAYRESVRLVRTYFQASIPFILIDSYIHGLPSTSFIGKDPVQSGTTVGKLIHQITRHIPGNKQIRLINLARNLNQIYSLLARETGFMNYFADHGLQGEYAIGTREIEDRNDPADLDRKMEELLGEGVPDAVYVTGSRVFKVAESLRRLMGEKKPLLIGHDLIPGNVQGVLNESIDFLIEEEARRQGYLSVESLYRKVICKEEIEKNQRMNLLIYTRENLPAEYLPQETA